jgi:hypothetical protein
MGSAQAAIALHTKVLQVPEKHVFRMLFSTETRQCHLVNLVIAFCHNPVLLVAFATVQ